MDRVFSDQQKAPSKEIRWAARILHRAATDSVGAEIGTKSGLITRLDTGGKVQTWWRTMFSISPRRQPKLGLNSTARNAKLSSRTAKIKPRTLHFSASRTRRWERRRC